MALRCEPCGIAFSSEREQNEHAELHVGGGPAPRVDVACDCGATFHSEADLERHASKAHGA